MNFKCPNCGEIYKRDGRTKVIKRKKYIQSYCTAKGLGKMVRMIKVKENK